MVGGAGALHLSEVGFLTNGIVSGAGLGAARVLEVHIVTSHPHSTEGSISSISKADYWQEKHI